MFSKRKDIIMKWEQRWVFCFRFWFLSWDIVALGLEHWTPIWGFRCQTWPGHLFQEGEEKWYSQSLHAMETGIGSSCMIVQLDILISIDLTFFFFFPEPLWFLYTCKPYPRQVYVSTVYGIPCMNMEVKVISLCFSLLIDMVLLNNLL